MRSSVMEGKALGTHYFLFRERAWVGTDNPMVLWGSWSEKNAIKIGKEVGVGLLDFGLKDG